MIRYEHNIKIQSNKLNENNREFHFATTIVLIVRLGQCSAKAKPKAITEFTLNHPPTKNFLGVSRLARKSIFGMQPHHNLTR